jgi:hypothetical protein
MTMSEGFPEVPGFDAVVRHFGRWPGFHDAVVEQLSLNLPGETLLAVRSWNMTSEVDDRGYFRHTHLALVKIFLTGVLQIEIGGTDIEAGCILFGLSLTKEGEAYQLVLDPTLGMGGAIRCRGVRLEVYPEEVSSL